MFDAGASVRGCVFHAAPLFVCVQSVVTIAKLLGF